MNSLVKENINIAVDSIRENTTTDLADLCSVTEQAIRAGGGFGWLTIPPRDTLKNYWNGIVLIKSNILIVGRLNKTIAGALLITFNPPNNEAQKNIAKIQSHFVAPWARGYGLAKAMIDQSIKTSKENRTRVIVTGILNFASFSTEYLEKSLKKIEKQLQKNNLSWKDVYFN